MRLQLSVPEEWCHQQHRKDLFPLRGVRLFQVLPDRCLVQPLVPPQENPQLVAAVGRSVLGAAGSTEKCSQDAGSDHHQSFF